jgi:ATP-dependent RNA helicase DDX18/HAS1
MDRTLIMICCLLGSRLPSVTPFSTASIYSSARSTRTTVHVDRIHQDDFDEDDWLAPFTENKAQSPKNQDRPRRSGNDRRGGGERRRFDNGVSRSDDESKSRRFNEDPVASLKREIVQSQQQKETDITDTNAHFFSQKSLRDPSLKMADNDLFLPLCRGAGITRPSKIQSIAWPQILSGKSTLVADQTGSGKTLAYLLPLLQRALSEPKMKTPGTPRVLILAPTAELADQIRAVCQKISESVPFSTMVVTANGKFETSIRDQIRRLQRTPIDVLISTPGRISTILRTRNSGLDLNSQLQSVVLDEVDILLIDETFGPQLRTISAAVPQLEKTQFVFVTATLPDQIVETVKAEFPDVVQVRGPGLHRVAPSLKERLVDVSVPSQYNQDGAMCFDVKAKQLLQALRQNRCRRTLIFCNTVDSCRDVENLLKRRDRKGSVYEVGAYHNAMTPENRNENLDVFAKGRQGDVDYILVCTDRAARGVDFDASPVDHVVIFDFPKDPAEYVRRVGRTARAGREGTSTVLAYGWQLPIARQVMGTKLDSFSIAGTELGENAGDEGLYSFRKDRRTKKRRATTIKETIESGQLWDQ